MPSPTNQERAAWAGEAVATFANCTGMSNEDGGKVISDLLCNLMHLCHINHYDFDELLLTGGMHFEAEIVEGGR